MEGLSSRAGVCSQGRVQQVDRDLQLQEREEVQKDVVRNSLGAVGAELQHSHWERNGIENQRPMEES